ncbi:hypothetical protein O181_095094 [Austropuccinia psidii MF-1]|uniref:Tet-like 2OG-Fe(II) oxygenase domain-containing protein n=1 Tax=Austropuccinia psidii MF-1 TaxID=1389203 RepID=A0A9Q3PBE8_9BASI|nr:hypothetical protein [Austropuccinia psidii MF-1]
MVKASITQHSTPSLYTHKTKKPFLPVIIYEVTIFDNSSGHSQILKSLFMTLISLSQNQQEIETNKQVLGGIMKGIGFCPGSDSGKSAGVKPGLTLHQIETDNNHWNKLQQYDQFVYSRISHFSELAENEKQSLMEAAKLPTFSQLECNSSNPKKEFKSFTNVIVTQDGFFNKPHQYSNDLNALTYGILYFV